MGLLDNTKNIELALTEKNKIEKQKQLEKAKREAEKIKKIEEKENLKKLQEDIKQEITTELEKYLDILGIDYITEFYSIKRRRDILNNIIKKYGTIKTQIWNNGEQTTYCSNKKDIEQIFNDNYYKILKKEENIYKLNDKYLYKKNMENAENIQPKKQNNFLKYCKIFIYIISFIVFFPLVFIFLIVLATCKSSK